MGIPQTPSASPHLYPQALQLKLYQAFIFSIPILFSIILFLLFYLFYLKRRASSVISQPVLPRAANQATAYLASVGLKGEPKDKLPIVLFDEELKKKDSQCCVCLGEFEFKEELLQVPSCKHVFHVECMDHWLHTNSTCPLCRCSVLPTSKLRTSASAGQFSPHHESIAPSLPLPPPPHIIVTEGSSSRDAFLMESNGFSNTSTYLERDYLHTESVALQIQTHNL